MSIIFKWNEAEFNNLLATCDRDEVAFYINKYLKKPGKILEAGCGLARYVKYLSDRGFQVEGLEYSEETVSFVKKLAPELNIVQGDVLNMPYQSNSFDGIISLGVIEHFIDGAGLPLKEMSRVLKTNGIAIITIPSFNYLRQLKNFFYFGEMRFLLKVVLCKFFPNKINNIFKRKPYNRNKYKSFVFPLVGDFFEYRFTKKEFEKLLIDNGYRIIESVPVGHMDGIFHEFGKFFVSFKNWKFYPNCMSNFK